MVEVVVRVPSDGMGLFKGVARRWSGRGGSAPAGEHPGAPLMAFRCRDAVCGGEDEAQDDWTPRAGGERRGRRCASTGASHVGALAGQGASSGWGGVALLAERRMARR